jgi:hypothetical protein
LLIKAQKNKNIFRKISLQGNEIEIFEEQNDSYFDKYLNEVLYLFENVEADVIVFEDMDRFNASRIFERLREVNTLVNIQRKKEQGDNYIPLRFFYLLRDDIFISKDRTKFFDYIIPIVPIVDSSNSYEQFLKHLKEGNLLDKFDQSFLQSLSLYVDDMRILKNIYNAKSGHPCGHGFGRLDKNIKVGGQKCRPPSEWLKYVVYDVLNACPKPVQWQYSDVPDASDAKTSRLLKK